MTRKKQASLQDVSRALAVAEKAIAEIECRAMYENPPKLSLEQKIIHAAREISEGHPLRDFLDEAELIEAISILGDVYTVTGVKMPPDWP